MTHLEIPVDDIHVVAVGNNADNDTDEGGGILLSVAALLDNGIEQFASAAYLHNEAHIALVLVHIEQADNVIMASKVMHDLDLTLDILNLLWASELPL